MDRLARERPAVRELPHDGALLADALVRAHGPQPPLERHGADHRPRHRLPGLRRAHPARERLPLGDARRPAGTRPGRWASGTSCPEEETHLGAPRARWPLGRGLRALLRLPRRRDAPVRAVARARQPLRRAAPLDRRRLPPHRGSRRPRDHRLSTTSARSMPTSRSSSTSPPGACHSPHQAPREWIERYRGRFDRGWDVARDEILERQKAMGLLPSRHRALAATRLGPGVGRAVGRRAAAVRPVHGGLRRVTSRTPTRSSAVSSTRSRRPATSTTRSSCWSPTTVRRRRVARRGRSTTCGRGTWWSVPLDEAIARIDEIGGPRLHNNYPWGWTVAGNTPFRRWKREVHEGGVADPLIVSWPQRHPAAG